jgi:hypothetical protein
MFPASAYTSNEAQKDRPVHGFVLEDFLGWHLGLGHSGPEYGFCSIFFERKIGESDIAD